MPLPISACDPAKKKRLTPCALAQEKKALLMRRFFSCVAISERPREPTPSQAKCRTASKWSLAREGRLRLLSIACLSVVLLLSVVMPPSVVLLVYSASISFSFSQRRKLSMLRERSCIPFSPLSLSLFRLSGRKIP